LPFGLADDGEKPGSKGRVAQNSFHPKGQKSGFTKTSKSSSLKIKMRRNAKASVDIPTLGGVIRLRGFGQHAL
jgi:hypothetical protein